MAASYPTTTKSFTTKTYGDLIQESHINDLQDEVIAIEDDLRAGLPISRGGTGATNSVNAATNLGVLPIAGGTLTGTLTGTTINALNANLTGTLDFGNTLGEKLYIYRNNNIKYGLGITAGYLQMFTESGYNISFGHMSNVDGTSFTERMKLDNNGVLTVGGNTVWNAGNDGSGSGLDADTLDTKQASDFLLVAGGTMTGVLTASTINATTVYSNISGTTITATGIIGTTITATTFQGNVNATTVTATNIAATSITATGTVSALNLSLTGTLLELKGSNAGVELGSLSGSNTPYVDFHSSGNNIDYDVRMLASSGTTVSGNGTLNVTAANLQVNGNNVWHVGNPGTTGSTLISTGTVSTYTEVDSTNYIIDGNFQIAQVNPVVGTEISNPTTGKYPVFDLYRTDIGGTMPTTLKHSQILITAGSVPGSKYCYRVNTSGDNAGLEVGGYNVIHTDIEHGTQNLCGLNKTLTLSFYARTSISGTKRIGVQLEQNYGTGGSPTTQEPLSGNNFTLTSTWTKFTHTFTTNTLVGKTFGTNNDDKIGINFWLCWGSNLATYSGASTAETFVGAGDIEIADVNLFKGSIALPSKHDTFANTLRKCQRYYEKSYNYEVAPGTASTLSYGMIAFGGTNNNYAMSPVRFKTKRITPVPKIYHSDGTVDSVGSGVGNTKIAITSVGYIGQNAIGYLQSAGLFGGGEPNYGHWTMDARF